MRRAKLAGEETRLLFLVGVVAGVDSAVVVLHVSFGVEGRDGEGVAVATATAVAVEVRQRRLYVPETERGVVGVEKKPNL